MNNDRYDDINETIAEDEGRTYDFRELEDGEEQRETLRSMKKGQSGETDDRKEERADDGNREVGNVEDEPHSDYEDVCFICRRPESKAGKMFHLPNHICVCDDCMHKTMDTVSQFDYQGMLNHPTMSDFNNGKGFPNISFVNLADLQGDGGIPNKQKPKKKKKDGDKAEIDIKNIMPPHKIKAKLDEYVVGQEYAKKWCP